MDNATIATISSYISVRTTAVPQNVAQRSHCATFPTTLAMASVKPRCTANVIAIAIVSIIHTILPV